MKNYETFFHSLEEVTNKIQQSLDNKKGLSLVRIGDGEAFSMGYEMVAGYQSIMQGYDYAGVPRANPQVRHLLLKAIQEADIVGLSDDRSVPLCAPLIEKILEKHNINLDYICHARINWHLHGGGSGPLYDLLKGKRVIIVGRLAQEAAPKMKQLGLKIVGTYPLEGINRLNSSYSRIHKDRRNFDVAIVSAGIPAVPLCVKLAKECNKVAIDFGHSINDLLQPGFNVKYLGETTLQWRRAMRDKIYKK